MATTPNEKPTHASSEAAPGARVGRIVTRLGGGLGNKLCGLLSAVVAGEITNSEVHAFWAPRSPGCFASYSDLFEPCRFPGVSIVEDYPSGVDWLPASRVTGDSLRRELAAGRTVHLHAHDLFGRDLLPLWQVDERVRERLRALQPVASVRQLLDHIPKTRFGIHVRMSDHLPCRMLTPRWCYRRVLRMLAKRYPGEPVLICSDTPRFVQGLKASHPGVISLPSPFEKSCDNRASLDGMRLALAEIWKLAQCEVVFAPPCSTFSRVASNLGGGRHFHLSSLPYRLRHWTTEMGWMISAQLEYDPKRDAWRGASKADTLVARGKFALLAGVASVACGSLHQDWPNAVQAGFLEWDLRRFCAAHVAAGLDSHVPNHSREP
jgi:hypothetical protein